MQVIKIEINNDAVKLSSLLLGSLDKKEATKMSAQLNKMRLEWERTI